MPAFQSRWGFHPVDYSTYRKLKTLHRRYWETVYSVARWTRWDRKTVHQTGPEPKYCPIFVQEKGHWESFTTREGTTAQRYRPKTLVDHGIIESYKTARMPAESPEAVKEIPLSKEQIDVLYEQVEAWFEKESKSKTART